MYYFYKSQSRPNSDDGTEFGKPLAAGENDVVFVYANIVDKNGTVVPDAVHSVQFSVEAMQN